jgi:hypothetical protein
MKINILFLVSFLILVFFAVAAHAFADSTGKTADQLISGDVVDTTPAGQSHDPQASRVSQTGQKGKDILNVTMGGKLNSIGYSSTSGYNAKDSRTQDLSQTSPVQNVAANTTAPAPAQVVAPSVPTSVSGGWSLELTDSALHTAALTLFQSGDAVYGTGNVNLDANKTMMAAASGTLTGGELNLDIVTLGKVNLYRLALMVSGESAAGNYTAYSPSASPSTGTAKCTRTVAS